MVGPLQRRSKSIIDYSKYLPNDLWLEIFLLLPLDSIFTSKCVSKLWLSLLSKPSFITRRFNNFNTPELPWTLFLHLHRPVNRSISTVSLDIHSKFICGHDGFSFKFLPSKPSPYNKEDLIFLLASSNGLVLCSTRRYYQMRYYICNPLTKKWIVVPRRPPNAHHKWVINGFICESSSSLASTSYKVVRVPEFKDPLTNFEIEIYSSNVGEWNIYKVSCPHQVTMLYNFSNNVVSGPNGVLYWIEVGEIKIIAYNPNDNHNNNDENGEKCRLIDLPIREGVNYDREYIFGVSEGLISYSYTQSGELSIWVLEDDLITGGWIWHLVHEIELEDMLAENSEADWFINQLSMGLVTLKPLAFNPIDRNVVILGYEVSFIFAYNIETRRLKMLNISCNSHPSFDIYPTYGGELPFVPFVLTPKPTPIL
ncbi:F-box domain [Macleaya cordata]|uniref:F-box domain n=1 Tax=Macleaya cordata TaxID=56857 RepID=A0A200PUW6_MACCD|nr:F-box domain [Macleaya cordata]